MASLFTYSRRDGSASGTQAVYQAALSRLASASAQDELLETFARALPYLTTLVALFFLPQVAHEALNYRRAQQVYDAHDKLKPDKKEEHKARTWGALLFEVMEWVAWLLTSKEQPSILTRGRFALLMMGSIKFAPEDGARFFWWHAFVRNYVPTAVLWEALHSSIYAVTERRDVAMARRSYYVNRSVLGDTKGKLVLKTMLVGHIGDQSDQVVVHKGHARVLSLAAAGLLSHLAASSLIDSRLALAIPALAFAVDLPFALRTPLLVRQHTSFRAFVLVPAALFGIAVALISLTAKSGQHSNVAQSSKCRGAQEPSFFAATFQLLSFMAPAASWLLALAIPATLCLLGYRYDAGVRASPTAEEIEASYEESKVSIVPSASASDTPQSTLAPRNRCDTRSPSILVGSISLPRLSLSSTPTFTAGYLSLAALHSMALLSTLLGLPPSGHHTAVPAVIHNGADCATLKALYTPHIGHLAVLFTPLAMLVAVELAGKGGASQLWHYSEKWPAHRSHDSASLAKNQDTALEGEKSLLDA